MHISIDWNEVILILIGALIGFAFSMITTIILRVIDKAGKLNIFFRFSVPQGGNYEKWGFEHIDDKKHFENQDKGLAFIVPIFYEFQNTSNTTRVIRDVSLLLCKDNRFIVNMTQITKTVTEKKSGGSCIEKKENVFGGENGSYSFVLPPRSIQKYECQYIHTFEPARPNEYIFNKLVLRYFDENNKQHFFELKDLSNLWDNHNYRVDREWKDVCAQKRIRVAFPNENDGVLN